MGDGSLSTGPGAQQVVEAVAFPDGDVAYFDTIAWNRLLDHPNRGRLITTMRASGVHVIASVFNAAEVAQTRDPERRRKLGAIVREVHGDGPLLEHPLMMAVPMAEAILRGEEAASIRSRRGTELLLQFLGDPTDEVLHQEAIAWVAKHEAKFETVFQRLTATKLDPSTHFLTGDVIASDEVLETLLTLPVAREAGMTLADLRTVVGADHDTVWTALAAMLAYLLELASREAGRRWRGAFDLWQAVYLGLPIRAFVTDDRALTEAACRLRDVLKEPREVMTAAQFFDRL